MADEVDHIKPKKGSFFFGRVVPVGVACLLVAIGSVVAASFIGSPLVAVAGVAQLFVFVGLALLSTTVAYKKERYELHPHHLVVFRGGLMSTETTELDLKNVTHVKQRLPWLRYRFFDVGDVIIESAGSSGSEATLRSIRHPDAVYERVRTLLKQNGFALQSERVLHRASPATIGVVFDSLGRGAAALATAVGVSVGLLTEARDASVGFGWVEALVIGIGAVGAIGAALAVVLHYLDMKRRTYTVTEDAVVYEEGFLSRDNAFIPYENIADADTKKTLVDQVIGLSDVKVSCQGSASEIVFRRLAGGAELSAALRGLVSKAAHQKSLSSKSASASPASLERAREDAPVSSSARSFGFVGVPPQEAWTATLRMSPVRAAVGYLPLLPVFPAWVVLTIVSIARSFAMTYRVGESAVSSRYSLIGEHEMSFAYDKVTGVVVRTNPWDLIFKTMTIRVLSIGSSTPIELAHVSAADVDLAALLRQVGIKGGAAVTTERADFNPASWARSALGEVIALGAFALGLLAAAAAIHWAIALALPALLLWLGVRYVVRRLQSQRQVLSFFPGHVELEEGVVFRTHSFTRYDNVKKVQVVRYPGGGDSGRLTLFVAGETLVQTKGGGGSGEGGAGIARQTTLTAHYLTGVDKMRTSIDALLSGQLAAADVTDVSAPAPERAPITARPALGNTLVPMVLVGLVLWPLLLFVPLTVWGLKRRSYRVDDKRVVVEEGILYRSHTSVLFDRIDSLKQDQGVLNQVFNNGSVTLLTAGSSAPDLVVSNVPNHQEVYRAIREHYGR